MLVLDASVWLNADSPAEPGYAYSRALLDALATSTAPSIAAPLLLPVEVAGVISRTRAQPELNSRPHFSYTIDAAVVSHHV